MKIYTLFLQLEFIIAFLFLNFGGTESAGNLSHSTIKDASIIKTEQPKNASNEKNNDVNEDEFLKNIVREYEIELEKELRRRFSENETDVRKVKREDYEAEAEKLEDSLMQNKLYRIVRKKRTIGTSGVLMTMLRNRGKDFIEKLKKNLIALLGLQMKGKLEELQNNVKKVFSPDSKKS